MKSLQQHIYENIFHKSEINEKLVINKDFKWGDASKPNREGKFLRLFINTNKNNHKSSYRIDLEIDEYKFKENIFRDNNGVYKKNEKGYYWTDERFSGFWLVLALFGDDAIEFLNTLLNNPNSKFNLFEYLDEPQKKLLNNKQRNVFIEKSDNHDMVIITKDNVLKLINEINEDIN